MTTHNASSVLAILTSTGTQDMASLEWKCRNAGIPAAAFHAAVMELLDAKAVSTTVHTVRARVGTHTYSAISVVKA